MSQQPFTARGAVDLGALAARRQAEEAAAARGGAPATGVVDVTEASFQADVIDPSFTVPVVVAFWSSRAGTADTPELAQAVATHAGRLLLRRVDADAEPRVAAAFGVQALPTVFAVVKGQPLGLYQGSPPAAQIAAVIDQVLEAAAANGVTGAVPADGEPAAAGSAAEPEPYEPPADPRFDAAYDAIEAGDWEAAEAAYRAVLAATPSDPVAQAGLAQVGLLGRTEGVDLDAAVAAADAAPDDLAAALAAADAQVLLGDPAAAFARLVAQVRATSGPERESVRARLLALFEVVGADDPTVAPARLALANALF